MTRYCFIGDIHGCVQQLDEVVSQARAQTDQFVFLGDYINRGPSSKDVLNYLIRLDIKAIFLVGNHDRAFLNVIKGDGFDEFLRIGGASTVLNYIDDEPQPDVLAQFRAAIPAEHVTFLENLRLTFQTNDLIALHRPTTASEIGCKNRFHVFGHKPQPSLKPFITENEALIDTGCGTLAGGRLTGFLWPSRQVIQSTPCDAKQSSFPIEAP
jgi:serine/threonine protein phosphatase 1